MALKGLKGLIGKYVEIEWNNYYHSQTDEEVWSDYAVLDVDQGFIKLQGVRDKHGSEYSGGPIWVNMSVIDLLEVCDVTQT